MRVVHSAVQRPSPTTDTPGQPRRTVGRAPFVWRTFGQHHGIVSAAIALVVLSGGLSQYNADQPSGPSNYLELLRARASMTGFITPDYTDQYPEARMELACWLREGLLISREQIIEGGARAFPDALLKLFAGANVGKLILAAAPGVEADLGE